MTYSLFIFYLLNPPTFANTLPTMPATLSKLTPTQAARFAAAEKHLPANLSYRLHDETSGKGRFFNLVIAGPRVWGVTVCDENGESLGHVQRPDKRGFISANSTKGRADVRAALNRAAAALWHRQPVWSS